MARSRSRRRYRDSRSRHLVNLVESPNRTDSRRRSRSRFQHGRGGSRHSPAHGGSGSARSSEALGICLRTAPPPQQAHMEAAREPCSTFISTTSGPPAWATELADTLAEQLTQRGLAQPGVLASVPEATISQAANSLAAREPFLAHAFQLVCSAVRSPAPPPREAEEQPINPTAQIAQALQKPRPPHSPPSPQRRPRLLRGLD